MSLALITVVLELTYDSDADGANVDEYNDAMNDAHQAVADVGAELSDEYERVELRDVRVQG